MIDVEIKAPVAKKEYEKLYTTLKGLGENVKEGYYLTLTYGDRGYNNREVRLEYKNGDSKIFVESGKKGAREEAVTMLADGEFSSALDMLAELGYKKGNVIAEKVLTAKYGGAYFSLFHPENDALYYEISIPAHNPTEVKENKQKLEAIAKQFKLPIWTALDMLEFMRRLHESQDTVYDYDTDGPEYFIKRFQV